MPLPRFPLYPPDRGSLLHWSAWRSDWYSVRWRKAPRWTLWYPPYRCKWYIRQSPSCRGRHHSALWGAVPSSRQWAVFLPPWYKISFERSASGLPCSASVSHKSLGYPSKHFSFSGKGPENPKNRKRVLACCACYRNPTFVFPSVNTTIWNGDFGCSEKIYRINWQRKRQRKNP